MTRKSPYFFTAPAVMNWEMKILLLLVKDSEISRKPKGMAKEKKVNYIHTNQSLVHWSHGK